MTRMHTELCERFPSDNAQNGLRSILTRVLNHHERIKALEVGAAGELPMQPLDVLRADLQHHFPDESQRWWILQLVEHIGDHEERLKRLEETKTSS
jgi:hypothetical protein